MLYNSVDVPDCFPSDLWLLLSMFLTLLHWYPMCMAEDIPCSISSCLPLSPTITVSRTRALVFSNFAFFSSKLWGSSSSPLTVYPKQRSFNWSLKLQFSYPNEWTVDTNDWRTQLDAQVSPFNSKATNVSGPHLCSKHEILPRACYSWPYCFCSFCSTLCSVHLPNFILLVKLITLIPVSLVKAATQY